MKGYCENPDCGRPIEWSGKTRKYCGWACRKKMSREHKLQEEREQLRNRWIRQHFHPDVVKILEALLDTGHLRTVKLITEVIEVQCKYVERTDEEQRP